jgi:uncharacterized protein (DUF924 family)
MIHAFKTKIVSFSQFWFPEDGSNPKYWFRARDKKFKNLITKSCEDSYNDLVRIAGAYSNPFDLKQELQSMRWGFFEMIILAIMFDQVPRNALAVQYGKFHEADPFDAKGNIDDSYSLSFANHILRSVNLHEIQDYRVICFFSLIFRHSNDFDSARQVLKSLAQDGEDFKVDSLPPLAAKFWYETDKRENQSRNSYKILSVVSTV